MNNNQPKRGAEPVHPLMDDQARAKLALEINALLAGDQPDLEPRTGGPAARNLAIDRVRIEEELDFVDTKRSAYVGL